MAASRLRSVSGATRASFKRTIAWLKLCAVRSYADSVTQNFMSERLAYGVKIDEIDFMKCRHVVRQCAELGQSLRWERLGTGNGDVHVGVGLGGAFRPGPKPDDLNVSAQDESGQMGDLLRDLSRASHEFLVEHVPSVAVLAMMSIGLRVVPAQSRKVMQGGPANKTFLQWTSFVTSLRCGAALVRGWSLTASPTLASPLSATYNALVSLHLIL